MVFLTIQKILFLYCSGTTFSISTKNRSLVSRVAVTKTPGTFDIFGIKFRKTTEESKYKNNNLCGLIVHSTNGSSGTVKKCIQRELPESQKILHSAGLNDSDHRCMSPIAACMIIRVSSDVTLPSQLTSANGSHAPQTAIWETIKASTIVISPS